MATFVANYYNGSLILLEGNYRESCTLTVLPEIENIWVSFSCSLCLVKISKCFAFEVLLNILTLAFKARFVHKRTTSVFSHNVSAPRRGRPSEGIN